MDFVDEYMIFRFLFDKGPDGRAGGPRLPGGESSISYSPHVPIRQRLNRRYSNLTDDNTASGENDYWSSNKRMSLLQSIRRKNRLDSISQRSDAPRSDVATQRLAEKREQFKRTASEPVAKKPGGKSAQAKEKPDQPSKLSRAGPFAGTLRRTKKLLRAATVSRFKRDSSERPAVHPKGRLQSSGNIKSSAPPVIARDIDKAEKPPDSPTIDYCIRKFKSLPNLESVTSFDSPQLQTPKEILTTNIDTDPQPDPVPDDEVYLDFYLPHIADCGSEIMAEPWGFRRRSASSRTPVLNAGAMMGLDGPGGDRRTHSEGGSVHDSIEKVDEQISSYLDDLQQPIHEIPEYDEGMNFLARHFFEYQTFTNEPDKGLQMHKPQPGCAGVDHSGCWAPRMIAKTGRHLPAPGARANRSSDTKGAHHRASSRTGAKNEYKEWGDRHGDLKPEKFAHKDLWSKFLTGEDTTIRDVFESEFEDKLLQIEAENLADKIKCQPMKESDFAMTAGERKLFATVQMSAVRAARRSRRRWQTFGHKPEHESWFAQKVDTIWDTLPAWLVPDVLFFSFMLETYQLLGDFRMTVPPPVKTLGSSELLLILTYAPSLQFITVTIKKAKNLPFNNIPFARLMVFENRRLIEQKQTTITPGLGRPSRRNKPNNDAEFSEAFLFQVTPARLSSVHAVVEIWDRPPDSKPVSVGHVVVGPSSNGRGILHWHQMIRRPGIPICMWHTLSSKH